MNVSFEADTIDIRLGYNNVIYTMLCNEVRAKHNYRCAEINSGLSYSSQSELPYTDKEHFSNIFW